MRKGKKQASKTKKVGRAKSAPKRAKAKKAKAQLMRGRLVSL